MLVLVPGVEVGVDCLGGWGGWLDGWLDGTDGPHHCHVHHCQCYEVALHNYGTCWNKIEVSKTCQKNIINNTLCMHNKN